MVSGVEGFDHYPAADDDRFVALAGRVADGQVIDWAVEAAGASNELERDVVGALLAIERLSSEACQNFEGQVARHEDVPPRWGHLEILGPLGRGSFGRVFVARDTLLDRLVALKLYPNSSSSPEERRAGVLREGRLLAKVKHTNIAAVFGVDQRDGRLGLWMELVRGQTLGDRVSTDKPLGAMEAALAGIEMCRALAAVHSAGILHRDIKAQNVIREDGGRLVLVDFGLGLESESREVATPSGTPLYLAPEVLAGASPSCQSDLYSLGVLMFYLVSGRYPVEGESLAELSKRHTEGRTGSLRDVRPDLPEAFVAAVECALAKDLSVRFSTAGAMERALLAVVGDPQLRRQGREMPQRRGLALAALGALVVAGLAYVLTQQGRLSTQGSGAAQVVPRRLTSGAAWETDPAISPDGTLVAYASNETGSLDLWMVDTRGGEPLRLTDDPAVDRRPAWFPDGSALLFQSDRGGREAIWKISRLGGPASFVTNGLEPAVSPSGDRLAFGLVGDNGFKRIAVLDLTRQADTKVLTHDSDGYGDHESPSWSPDGKSLAYVDLSNVWVVSAEGGESRRLTRDAAGATSPTWSADGRWVYFGSYREGALAIWRSLANGDASERVTFGSGSENQARVSSDGSRLTYSTSEDRVDLAIARPATGEIHRIQSSGTEVFPVFAPNAEALAYVTDRYGLAQLWTLTLRKGLPIGIPRPLVSGRGAVSHPAYSPDGRWIAYQRREGEKRRVHIVPSVGGKETPFLSSDFTEIAPSWSSDGRNLAFVSDREGALQLWAVAVRDGRAAGAPWRVAAPSVTPITSDWSPDGTRIAFVATGAKGDAEEVFVVDSSGDSPPRRITSGAGAQRARWVSNQELLVSGLWGGAQFELRRVPVAGGQPGAALVGIDFGSTRDGGQFDISRDREWVAYSYGDNVGDIWVLEGRAGRF